MRAIYNTVIKIVEENSEHRKLIFWGNNKELEETFIERGYKVYEATYVKEKVCNNVFFLENFKNEKENYYIVVPWLEYNEKRVNLLKDLGYELIKDCCFLKHEKQIIRLKAGEKYVDKLFNNYFYSESNNDIYVTLGEKANGSRVNIGKNVTGSLNIFIAASNNYIFVHEDVAFYDTKVYMYAGTKLEIGEKTTFNSKCYFSINHGCSIEVGKDCMFSFECVLHSGDGHAIYDLETKQKVNMKSENSKITLGDHVWVGFRAMILNNTTIGNGSIVGAGSLVKGIFPINCILAGSPAKVIKTNRAWARNPNALSIEECGEVYQLK